MVLEAAKLAYVNKTEKSITSEKLGSWDFMRIANSFLNKGKSARPQNLQLKTTHKKLHVPPPLPLLLQFSGTQVPVA